jgi:Ca2+-binding EF-hand superfamily protein
MPVKDIKSALTQLFHRYDKDKNGKIDRFEFQCLIKLIGTYTEQEIDVLFTQIDENKDGKIELKEFIGGLLMMNKF